MDVVNEIEILETDVKDCKHDENCQRVDCNAIYDAIMSSPSCTDFPFLHSQLESSLSENILHQYWQHP